MKASVFFGLLVNRRTSEAKVLEQLDADAVIAAVGLVAQRQVGLDRVEALVLQVVGLDLLDQADAAAFLRQIDQHAGPFLADHLHGQVELVAAIAAQRGQQVAGEAGRVQPHQRLRPRGGSPMTIANGSCGSYFTP